MTVALGIEDKSATVLIVESAASARQVISAVLSELGFRNLRSMDSVQSALDYLSQEEADYIICPLSQTDTPNALQLLRTLRSDDELCRVPVSFFVSEDSRHLLPSAFELGLVSCHNRFFSKESVSQEFSRLFSQFKQSAFNSATVALYYLHVFYSAEKLFETSKKCIETFLTHFPDSRQARLILADATLASGDIDEGKRLLGQFRAMNYEGWKDVALSYFSSLDQVPAQIGFTPCLVIDSDETIHNNLKKIFEGFPEFRIVPFQSGLAADEWCKKNGTPGLIIQEWKLRDLPGPAFLQRIRQRGWHDVPILVLSSLVTKNDAPLLKEMGVTEVFEKPVERERFMEALVFALVQEKDPTDLGVLERKISRLLNMGNFDYAMFLKSRVDRHPKATPGHRIYIESLFAFHRGKYDDARSKAIDAAQKGGDSLKCLTVLARSLVRVRDFSGAVKCFEKARTICPANVERLCELADVLSEAGEFSRAESTIADAKNFDPSSELVNKTESKVFIRSGQIDRAKSIIVHMGQVSGLVSEMNNSAVALVKVSEFEQALDLYRHTYEALPEELSETRLRVKYNLALAYARAGFLKETLSELEDFAPLEGSQVSKKIESLKAKVKSALETKRPLKLVSETGHEETVSVGETIAALGLAADLRQAGSDTQGRQAGLYGYFEASADERKKATPILERPVKFVRKKSMQDPGQAS